MKKMFCLMATLLLAGSSYLAAGDANPPLLCDLPEAVVVASSPACPPPAETVCPPAPPACPPTPTQCEEYTVVQVPVKTTVHEVVAVPVKKRVVEEECYMAQEQRTTTVNEVRTRTAKRVVEVPDTKFVSEAKIIKVASASGKATRLARGVSRTVAATTRKEVQEYEETYLHPIKHNYTELVPKTRKVTRYVEEYKTVTKPKTVTTMESRVVRKR